MSALEHFNLRCVISAGCNITLLRQAASQYGQYSCFAFLAQLVSPTHKVSHLKFNMLWRKNRNSQLFNVPDVIKLRIFWGIITIPAYENLTPY